ncbi:MAG: efflux RND transporter permease subunit [Balneola sp.]|nr:MAG: efflux RND transporter permease subunit [Balneola sp.]
MEELLRRKYLISFFYLMVCLVGFVAWNSISIEQTPELNLPSITVSYSWGSTVPEIMEQEITRKVESAANRLRDVSEIRSITQEGRSSVTITFFKNAPVEFRALEMREYLNTLEADLPTNISPASISRQVPQELEDQQTFLIFTLSGELQGKTLLEYARQNIKTQLLGTEGLADIKLEGVEDPALIIEFDRDQLEKYDISPSLVLVEIRDKLSWNGAGFVDGMGERTSLILPPVFNQRADIAGMRISLPGSQRQLLLEEIASVSVTDYPSKTKRRINGNPALTIEFVKEGGADALELAKEIIEKMEIIESKIPEGMELRMQFDSTEELREQFDELATQAMLSGVLVFVIVLLFIRSLRAPLIIIGSVLFSVLMSIALLLVFNYTLNVITLAGITIALGMLIDNAVVVFEQINSELPLSRQERSKHIIGKLGNAVVPVFGSTFTTIGIFIPLLFALDELKLFLMPLAVALTLTLVCSVLIAFTWIPYALIWLTSEKENGSAKKPRRNIVSNKLGLQLLFYRNKLKWVVLAALIWLIGVPLFLIPDPDWESTNWPEFTQVYFDNRDNIDPWIGGITQKFVSETYFGSPWSRSEQEYITVYIRSPQGTPLSEIDKIVANYETIVKPYQQAFTYYEAQMSEYYGAHIRFAVDPDYLFNPDPYYFFGEAMYLAARTGNVATSVSGFGDGISTGFGGQSSSHRIQLTGYSYDELYELAGEIQRRLERNRRVREVDINSSSYFSRNDFQQYKLELDNETIVAKGLDRREVLQALSIDLNPTNTVSKVEFEGQKMYLIGTTGAELMYEEDLMNTPRETQNASFNLARISEIQKEKALTEIRRNNQSYERTITLNFLGNFRMGREYIQQTLDAVPVPVGASINYGFSFFGRDNEETTRNLWFIAFLSVLSVWMIVSALLESWKGPLFVILAVPLCGIGIMLGTLSNDLAFDRGAIAGALLSIGVVVNNAILLIHQHQLELKKGIGGLRNWLYVFRKKIRTILITTTTTIAGLTPMLIFGSNEFWEPLAVIVIWGLLFSTGLLLFVSGMWVKK